MPTLQDQLLNPAHKPALVQDCSRLIDDEVDRKSGLSGLAIKGAFKAVKAVKPGFIEGVIETLLPEWIAKLEGHYTRWQDQGATGRFGDFVQRDASGVAEKLLEVTDARAHKIENKTVATLYGKLRPSAKEHVVASVPGLARVVDKHLA